MYMLSLTLSIVLAILTTVCNVVQSSSAGFTISAIGQQLNVTDETADIPTYSLQMQVNQVVTLVAQGIVMPRGQPSEPFEPDAGAWLFNDIIFRLLPYDKTNFNNTQIPIMLKALRTVAVQTRVRFVGDILGYYRKYDVFVRVTK